MPLASLTPPQWFFHTHTQPHIQHAPRKALHSSVTTLLALTQKRSKLKPKRHAPYHRKKGKNHLTNLKIIAFYMYIMRVCVCMCVSCNTLSTYKEIVDERIHFFVWKYYSFVVVSLWNVAVLDPIINSVACLWAYIVLIETISLHHPEEECFYCVTSIICRYVRVCVPYLKNIVSELAEPQRYRTNTH